MTMLTRIAVGLVAVTTAAAPARAQSRPLEGVWTRVEVHVIAEDGETVQTNLQSSLYIFTREFFSVMYVDGLEPRPLRGPRAKSQLTDAEKIAEYDTFIGYSGTYEVEGSTLTLRPRVALNPSFMAGGGRRDEFEVDGNVLWLILSAQSGPIQQIRVKLVRLEGGLGSGESFPVAAPAGQ